MRCLTPRADDLLPHRRASDSLSLPTGFFPRRRSIFLLSADSNSRVGGATFRTRWPTGKLREQDSSTEQDSRVCARGTADSLPDGLRKLRVRRARRASAKGEVRHNHDLGLCLFPATQRSPHSPSIYHLTQDMKLVASVAQAATHKYDLEATLIKLERLVKLAKERDGSGLIVFPEALCVPISLNLRPSSLCPWS